MHLNQESVLVKNEFVCTAPFRETSSSQTVHSFSREKCTKTHLLAIPTDSHT